MKSTRLRLADAITHRMRVRTPMASRRRAIAPISRPVGFCTDRSEFLSTSPEKPHAGEGFQLGHPLELPTPVPAPRWSSRPSPADRESQSATHRRSLPSMPVLLSSRTDFPGRWRIRTRDHGDLRFKPGRTWKAKDGGHGGFAGQEDDPAQLAHAIAAAKEFAGRPGRQPGDMLFVELPKQARFNLYRTIETLPGYLAVSDKSQPEATRHAVCYCQMPDDYDSDATIADEP